ncbi:NAD(P)H-binding protein [Halomonas sp. AOP22-C1-8]|uniref:NAD(P)H-binding protein n=1 Tax=unclassified Halomonas TaxID=2609666 RepID=UPI004033B95A
MTTLVIGANGQIGKQFCELAQQAGEPIKAMIRDESQAEWFSERQIPIIVADLEGEFEHAFEDCDQVIFTAGSGPHTGPDKTLIIDLYGAIRAADIASEKGLDRYIMVSAIRAEHPLEAPEKMRPYMAAKFAADSHLRFAKVPHVILKPGPLTNEKATHGFAGTMEASPEQSITRADVAHALLHVVKTPTLKDKEFTLLNGKERISDLVR